MNSQPSLSPTVKRSTRTRDGDRDHSANAASPSATAGPELARNSSVQQHNLADNAEAAALPAAAADAAAAATTEPRILRAVLLAAAAAANALALAQTIPPDTVLAHRRGGRPPPTRRANPRPNARPRRRTRQSQHNPLAATANSLSREGQTRPRPGAPITSSNHAASSAMPATRNVPPKIEPTVMRVNGRD
jgi:hypothetical protein